MSISMLKIWLQFLISKIIGQICQFLQFLHTGTKMSKRKSRVTQPNITKFSHNVGKSMGFSLAHQRSDIPICFGTTAPQMNVFLPKTLTLPIKLVDMAMFLERSPNECRIYQAFTYLTNPENLLKFFRLLCS